MHFTTFFIPTEGKTANPPLFLSLSLSCGSVCALKKAANMEECLQYMKALRSQINDVEEQSAKISVEEQKQITTIKNLEKDLDLAKSKTRQLKEDTDKMAKEKGQICSQILETQRKIAALEFDSSTLSQTLELVQQERVSLSAKLVEKRAYYTEVAEDTNAKFQEQQEWINSNKLSSILVQHDLVNGKINEKDTETKSTPGKHDVESHLIANNQDNVVKDLMTTLDAAKEKFDSVTQMKSKLVSENSKVKESIDIVKRKANDFKPELREMDEKHMEEEFQALLSDKSGLIEYLDSLQQQVEKLKGISHAIKCACGEEYKVKVDLCE